MIFCILQELAPWKIFEAALQPLLKILILPCSTLSVGPSTSRAATVHCICRVPTVIWVTIHFLPLLVVFNLTGYVDILTYLCTVLRLAPTNVRHTVLNLQNASGNTALHWASVNGQLEAVKILLAAGADPSVKNLAGHDAVYEAEINSKDAVVEWLLNKENSLGSGTAVDEGYAVANDQSLDKTEDQNINQKVENLTIGWGPCIIPGNTSTPSAGVFKKPLSYQLNRTLGGSEEWARADAPLG